MSGHPDPPTRDALPGLWPQAFGVVGGMAAWGVAVLTAYGVVPVACALAMPVLVHLVRWIALAVAVASTVTAVMVYRRAQRIDDRGGTETRVRNARFLGFGGALVSAAGALLLVVEDLATWVIDPCL